MGDKNMNLKSDERKDLFKYMINEDKPNGDQRWGWYAGGQLEALEFYLDEDKVNILATYMEDDYQGECFAILKIDDVYIIWRDSFGSCSGCDALEGENGYEYIKETLSEGNTLQFHSLNDAELYVMEDLNGDKYSEWNSMPLTMFNEAKRNE
jgi:hypothetical protein